MNRINRILQSLMIGSIVAFLLLETATAFTQSFSPIVKRERKKVVHISTSMIVQQRTIPDPFFDRYFPGIPKKRRTSALGTGFLISSDGYIVTNNHVIEKAKKIEVVLLNEKKYRAKIVGKDTMTDLALLKIDVKGQEYVEFGDSDAVEIGDWVLAIGNPFGLDHSVSAGIVSAKERGIFGETYAYGQFLQTDAAINFGNSGGPLYDIDGKVIGINTAIAAGGQGIGFAIPSNLAAKVIDQLRQEGKVVRGYFGVVPQEVDHDLAKSFGMEKYSRGIILNKVEEDSPAGRAGLQQGDIVVEFEGKKIVREGQFRQYIAETAPGDRVEVKLFRNGKYLSKKVKVGEAPVAESVSHRSDAFDYGMQLVEITPEMKSRLKVAENYGLLVYRIDETKIAWQKGVRQGDVIMEAMGLQLKTPKDFADVLEKARKTGYPFANLFVIRNGNPLFLALPVMK